METDYLGLKDTCKRTGLSPRTLRAWVHDPVCPLPAYRVGGKLLFKWSDVERWIQQFRVKPVDVRAVADEFLSSMRER